MKFKGDIIITDPCYVVKKRHDYWNDPTYPKWKDFMVDDTLKLIDSTEDFINASKDEEQKKFRKIWIRCCREAFDLAELEWQKSHKDLMKDDWEDCNFGEDMSALGFNTFISEDTLYGDWSCKTYETGSNKELGEFCADAGMVCVLLLDEVLKYNPDFDYHIKRQHTTTLIKGFDGDIHTEVVSAINHDITGEDEDDVEEELRVIGVGNINFYTTQTGY